jgi:hypothetical protein
LILILSHTENAAGPMETLLIAAARVAISFPSPRPPFQRTGAAVSTGKVPVPAC